MFSRIIYTLSLVPNTISQENCLAEREPVDRALEILSATIARFQQTVYFASVISSRSPFCRQILFPDADTKTR